MSLINNTSERLSKIEENLHENPFPTYILLESYAGCNIHCVQCSNHEMTRPKGEMDIYLFKKIIDEIADGHNDVKTWLCGFGEPLIIRYKLYYQIEYAKKRGLKNVIVNTNGTLLDDEMADLLLESGLDYIVVGLDAFSKELYEKTRVGANRDVVYNNIINLKNKAVQRGNPLIIEAQFIIMDENKDELEDFKAFWAQQGVRVKVREKISWTKTIDNKSSLIKTSNRIACGWALSAFPISWDGNAVNCGTDMHGKNIWGNLKESTIQEIWNKRLVNSIKPHLEHRFQDLPSMCKGCKDWQIVGTKNYDETGKEFKVSYK